METKLVSEKKMPARHYGIDLLRILCMFMILFLHYLCYGGLMVFPDGQLDAPGAVMWWIYALTYVAVGCYVLISGYFLVGQTFRFSRLIKLLLQVYVYSIGVAAVLSVLGKTAVTPIMLRPISGRHYWFVTNYIGLYMLVPILNRFVGAMNKRQHLGLILTVLVMLSLWRDLVPTNDSPFFASTSYSLPLFVELYFIAAYLRLYVDVEKIKRPLVVYFICTFAVFAVWLILTVATVCGIELGLEISSDYFYRNHSVPVILGAVSLFVAFLKLRIKNTFLIKAITLVSPLTLGVYLIHEHSAVRWRLWEKVMAVAPLSRNLLMPVYALLVVVALYAILLAVDFLRAKVFGILEAAGWYKKIMKGADNMAERVGEKVIHFFARIGE